MRAKSQGALIGTGVGDALGASFEGWGKANPEEIEAVTEKQKVLTYTDDTHMMIGIAESLIQKRGFDGEHMAQTFITNYQAEPWRGYGPGPPRIFRMINAGEPWDKASSKLYASGSFGNGSAMRIAPIGLLYSTHPVKLREIAYKSSMITHSHELGKEGAALQAYAVALAANAQPERELAQKTFIKKLYDFVRHPLYRQKIASISDLLIKEDTTEVISILGHGVEAYQSVPTAIYSFLKHPKSYTDTVLYAISLGGDTDTIAAMAGAISGAYLGVEAIPNRWQGKLENHPYIKALADKLWQLALAKHKRLEL